MDATTLRDETITRLIAAGTTAGSKVFSSKATPNMLTNLPSICVHTPAESGEQVVSGQINPVFNKVFDLVIEVYVAGSNTVADDMDALMQSVEAATYTDSTWLALFTRLNGYTKQEIVEDGGEQLIAIGVLTIGIEQAAVEYDAGL